jgi:hypothetical protein
MNWEKYSLDDTVSKTTRTTVLWQAERGLMELSNDSFAVAIKLGDEKKGYVFHGHGKLLLDTIVETREGAVGKPIEKEIAQPFLMLGRMDENLSEASQEDFTKEGYADQQEFLTKARELFDRFFERRTHGHHCFDVDRGLIFAFPNEDDKFDLLVAKDSGIVYKAREMVFVSNGDKTVLKSPKEAVCVTDGKSVIVKGCCVHSSLMFRKDCP